MTIFENSRDIIYRADVLPQFKFTYISPAIEEILGISVEEILKDSRIPFKNVHPDDCKCLIKKIEGTADYSKPIQTRFKNKEGQYIWLEDYVIPIYDDNNVLIAIEGVSRNVQERKELEEELKKLSYFDYLTGLYNRAYINEQIGIINAERNVSVGVFIFDLDNLKYINDTLGHLYGDLLLKNTTNFLSNMFRDAIIGRVGGDEFVVILEGTSLDVVEEYYNNLNKARQKHNSCCKSIPVEVSVGYAFSENSTGNMYELINTADKNMYEHKKSKKTNYL